MALAKSMAPLAKRVVRHRAFEVSMATTIMINGAVLVYETDHRPDEDTAVWLASDWTFTSIFIFEMLVRMLALRRNWHRSAWNVFDALLVVISVVDVAVLPLLQNNSDLRIISVLRVVRIFRMLRILRLLRVFRFAHQLVLLLAAIWAAMRAMFWAMILVTLALYTCGMLVTRLVGKDCCDESDSFQDPNIRAWYGTLPRTLFTLFQIMTLEGWPDIARLTLTSHPWLTIFYVFFIVLTSVSLLNTVAGVLTDSILDTSRKKHQESQEIKDREMEGRLQEIAAEFSDEDSGRLDEATFREAAESMGPLREFLLEVNYMDDAGNLEPALELFRLLADEDGRVSRETFVNAVRSSRGPIKSKHLLAVKREIHRLDPLIEEAGALMQQVTARLRVLQGGLSLQGNGSSATNAPSGDAGAEGSGRLEGRWLPTIATIDASLLPAPQCRDAVSLDELRFELHDRLSTMDDRVDRRLRGVDIVSADGDTYQVATESKPISGVSRSSSMLDLVEAAGSTGASSPTQTSASKCTVK